MSHETRVVLFDVGGVLVQLNGVPIMLQWMNHRVSADELWKIWLTSPVVRAFESGKIAPEDFADRLIEDMKLPVERECLLREFVAWTLGLYPGALDLVESVPRRYVRATLCNTNALHWPRLMIDLKLAEAFDHHFASHITGKLKPDEEAFLHVAETLDCRADEILFIDDNRLNVEGALRTGMRAFQVRGVDEARSVLREAGILENN
ncbi:MAG: HAD-IA family hydrolase [Acidobacteriia bacterium]|nr:HAD-IA family hydrolase [Terriglobia bacterium]